MFDTQLDLLSYVPFPVPMAPPAKLRPYQVRAVDACASAVRIGRHPVLSLPTGSGKSRVIAALCDQLPGRILVATHRQELLEQNAAQLQNYVDGMVDYGIYSAGLGRRESDARIVFGGIQSIYGRIEALQHYGMFDYVIVDECHRVPPPSQSSMYGTVFRACPQAKRIGLTATPYRLGSGLLHEGDDTWFDTMPIHVGITDLTPEYLSPLVGVLTAHDIDVSQVRTKAGEFVTSDLSQVACEEAAVKGAIAEICTLAQYRKKWLLFCVDVAHTRLVTMALREQGIDAKLLLGETPQDARQDILQQFRDGTLRALVNCEVATTGFDIPDIDTVILLRPTQSKALVVQMLGRGTRKAPGKQDALVLDFSGNIERHAPLDELQRIGKSPDREEMDEERERQAAAARERLAKHREQASLADPMSAKTPETVTYRVSKVTYRVQNAKRFTGRQMLLASYHCPQRRAQSYVTQFLCVEHDGWAREQAAAWFERRGRHMPVTAQAALTLAYSLPQPQSIVVREDAQWPRVLMEQFAEATEEVRLW